MLTTISVLVPTRHRRERLQTLLESFRHTVRGTHTDLVFRVDEDDYETRNFLLTHGDHRLVIGPRFGGYQSMPVFFNELYRASSGDVLLCGNDDMVFRTPDWPDLILAEANRFPDGVFDLGVRTHNETHYPFSIVSRRAADALGFLWDPRIFWGDMFLRDVMRTFGRTIMVPSVRIDHDWAGFQPDQVFVESDKDILGKDPTYWSGTHARAVCDAVARLTPICAARRDLVGSWPV